MMIVPNAGLPTPSDTFYQTSRRHFFPLLILTTLIVLVAFPVVASIFTGRVPGWEGDNLYYVRSMWWMKRALLELGISPLFDPTAYFPVGQATGRSELTVTNTLLGLPVTVLAGPAAAYTVMILFSFIATAAGTYLWVEHLTRRRDAAVLAACIFTFLPYRFAHMAGHLPQMTTQWIPLTLYAFELFLDRRSVGRAVFLGAMAAFVVLGCWYYGYALALIFPVYVVLRTWSNRPLWRDRAWWLGLVVSGAVALALVLPLLLPMLRLRASGELARTLGEMDSWSLNVYDMFIPNLAHPGWGEFAARAFPRQRALWVEAAHSLGYVAVLVAVLGAAGARRQRLLLTLGGTFLVAFSIALGPTLHWGDRQVRVPATPATARAVAGLLPPAENTRAVRESFAMDGIPVPLPSLFFYKYLPLTSSMRVMARFSIWCALMIAALAAFGLIRLTAAAERRWGPAARGAVPAVVVALVCFESLSIVPTMAVGPRVVDTWLAQQPADVVVVELPVEQGLRPFQNYWVTQNKRRNLFGWNGDSFPPPILAERMAVLQDFPSARSVEYLRNAGTTYVLTTPSQIPAWDTMERSLNEAPGLRLEQTLGDVRVYRVLR